MKPQAYAFRISRKAMMPLSLASLLILTATVPMLHTPTKFRRAIAPSGSPHPVQRVLWHEGNFRTLEAISADDFVSYAESLPPSYEGYGKLSSNRRTNFNLFLDALFTAIDASLIDGNSADWCAVKTKAGAAGFEIFRLYDRQAGRWFIFSRDATTYGQAYFFINPFAKRNIVIEVPHEPFDQRTKLQGARIFLGLAARALIINKADRCSDPDTSGCFLDYSPTVCGGRYRESDVAHHPDNAFHLLHMRYTDMDLVTKFVQLHGFGTSQGYNAEIADGTKNDAHLSSVSVAFANHLRSQVPAGDAGLVFACQEFGDGKPPSGRCATKNLQGRYTNNPGSSGCLSDTDLYSGRFLHIEQAQTLRDDNDSDDGWYWGDVMEALRRTWGDCNMNSGPTDCSLGPRQTEYGPWACP